MSSQEQSGRRVVFFSPLDWGLAVVAAHRSALLTFALLPLLLEIIGGAYAYYLPVQPQHRFLLAVMLVTADALVLSTVAMYVIETIRGQVPSPAACIGRALRLLPKVFLSDALVVLSFGFAFFAPIAFILVTFVMWAPAFVVGETYAPIPKAEEDEDLLDEDMLEESYYRERVKRALSFFTDKAIWDLGISRSIRFASIHFTTSLHLSLLFWAARLLPLSLLFMIFQGRESLPILILQLSAIRLLHVLAAGAWAAVFLALLPEKAKEELSIPLQLEANAEITRRLRKPFRLPGRNILNLVLFTAAVVPYLYLQNKAQDFEPAPPKFSLEVIAADKIGEQLVVRVRISDEIDRLRWFDPTRFRLRYLNFSMPVEAAPPVEPAADERKSLQKLLEQRASVKQEHKDPNLLEPLGFEAYHDDGTPIREVDFTPAYEPLRFAVFFKQPKNLPESGSIELSYAPGDQAENTAGDKDGNKEGKTGQRWTAPFGPKQ